MSGSGDDPSRNGNESNGKQSKVALGKRPFSKIDLDGHDLPPSPAPSSPRNGKRYALATELVYTEGTDQYGASSTPIYQVSPIAMETSIKPCLERPISAGVCLSSMLADHACSLQHSSRHPDQGGPNMIIHDQETLHERILRDTLPKSCLRNAHSSCPQGWAPSM